MTPSISVVLSKVSEHNYKCEVRDQRTLYIEDRPCQAINARWFENFPGCRALSIYMPRGDFADFLLYVPDGENTVYVVPRGKVAHDTGWAKSALEPYREAWHLLKETTSTLFERKTKPLSDQLRTVIAAAEKSNLPYELIRTKRGKRKYAQRRILIKGKRCAIFTANILPQSNNYSWDVAHFPVPKDDWAEILLYILDDDVYVVPRAAMPHETTLSLDSGRVYDYRNSWCVLDSVDPTRSRQSASR